MLETIKSWFAWEVVRDSGVWQYSENKITGDRQAKMIGVGHQPLDFDWLKNSPSGVFQVNTEHGCLVRSPNINPPPPEGLVPLSPPPAPGRHDARQWQPTHRHNKGGKYRVLHEGILEANLTPVVIYQAFDGTIWVRPSAEFNDGRFTKIED